jgi:uncharacterized protein YndB with AHSA1/START domain
MTDEPFELGRRTKTLPAPPNIVWESLTDPHRDRTRPWLFLRPDEVEPQILEAKAPDLVVWSSLWPETPDQVIRFELARSSDSGTLLTWTLTSPVELDPAAVGHRRFRLNHLLWADLRYSYGR